MMTSFALPDRRVLRVDLYPRVTDRKTFSDRLCTQAEVDLLSGFLRTFTRFHDKRQTRIDAVSIFLGLFGRHFVDGVRSGVDEILFRIAVSK